MIRKTRPQNLSAINRKYTSPSSALATRLLIRGLKETKKFCGGRLLDVGCGNKPYAALYNAQSHIGLDWPETRYRTTADVHGKADSLPFKPHTFDTVLLTEVLEHLPDPRTCAGQIAAVLKPGGHLILSVPFYHWIHEAPHDYYRYTPYGLRELLESRGLEVVHFESKGGALCALADLSSRWLNMLLNRFLRKLKIGGAPAEGLAFVWIEAPQTLFFAIIDFIYRRFPYLARVIDPSERISLGYIAAARKI